MAMDVSVLAFVVAAAATLVGAVIQGSIGFGMNLLTVPALALVLPEYLPVSVIVLGMPISIGMLLHEHHAIDRKGIAWIMLGRVPGTVFGAWVVTSVTTTTLQAIVGVVVLLLVVASAASPPVPVRRDTQVAAGIVSGTTGTAAGIGGPPLGLLYQHSTGATLRSTLSATFLLGTLLSLSTLGAAGEVHGRQLLLGAGLAPLAIGGSVLGRRLHRLLDGGWLRPGVLVIACAAAVTAIVKAAA